MKYHLTPVRMVIIKKKKKKPKQQHGSVGKSAYYVDINSIQVQNQNPHRGNKRTDS